MEPSAWSPGTAERLCEQSESSLEIQERHEPPMCQPLGTGWDKCWVLCVASLLDDITNGRGGGHSVLKKESRTGAPVGCDI